MKKIVLPLTTIVFFSFFLFECKEKDDDIKKINFNISEILNTDWSVQGNYWLVDDNGKRLDTVNYTFNDTFGIIDSFGIIKCIYKGKSSFKTENVTYLGMRKPLNKLTQNVTGETKAVLSLFSGHWDYKGVLTSPTGAPNRIIALSNNNHLQFEKNSNGEISLVSVLPNPSGGQFLIEEGIALYKKAWNRYELQVRSSNRVR